MSSRLTDKEAKLLAASMANVDGGATAIMKLIDFSKVFGPAGYQDVRNVKVMFVRLMNKIVDDGLEGTPGHYKKSDPKAKKGSTAGDEGMESSLSAGLTPLKPTKKRKIASELFEEEDTPTKRVHGAPKGSKMATADGEELLSDDKGTSGHKAVGLGLKKKRKEVVLSASEEEVL